MDFKNICSEVQEIARTTGKFMLNERKNFDIGAIEYKGKNDMVSYVDKTAEQQIVNGLKPLIEGAGFITEENTINIQGEVYNWIIDPLDGTTNFVHGIPCYCVSIGLTKGNDLVLGVIYEPNLDECFYAWEGSPAYLNGKEIKTSSVSSLSQSLLATGFPYTNYSLMKPYMEVFDYCMKNTHGVRRWGSAAIDLAYVACGRFEAFYEYGLKPWDVAAGAFIVQQAGGKLTDFKGGADYLFGQEMIAGNTLMHKELLEVIRKIFKN